MKIINLIILILIANIAISQNQPIINGVESFEQWDSTAAGELPRFWDGFNRQIIMGGINVGDVVCISKDSANPQDMNYSVRLENKSVLGGAAVPGMLTCGKLNIDFTAQNGNITEGVAYSQKPAAFKGWYKYNPAIGDSALISVWFKQAGQKIGGGEIRIANAETNWTEFNVNINYQIGSQPDTMFILISSSSSKNNVPMGSVLDIDHIWFEGGSLSSSNLPINSLNFSAFPNPASDAVNLIIPNNNENTTINVYNSINQRLISTNTNSTNHTIDISALPAGVYFIEVSNHSEKAIKSIIVE